VAGRRARSARPTPPRSQHFLRKSLAADLVRVSGVGKRDLVLDLGAGTGRLTSELARAARKVVAIELDPRLADQLRCRGWSNVEVIEADAVGIVLPREPFRVVANVPFGRTNDLLHMLFDDPRAPLVRADLVVEWGVAVKRALPWPSSVSGVLWNSAYEISVSRRLPPNAFDPPPTVAAGVLVFRRRDEPLVRPELAAEYRGFVAHGFRRGLRAVAPPTAVSKVSERGAIPRELDAFQWAALFDVCHSTRE
jgi:23S rRNA (adenine-N6)-dimethyltransferase